ncbi:MAG: N-acetylneuraminate synthase family protein [Aequorivita sp.]
MKQTYVIGEIGQNHNGSVELAKNIIDASITTIMSHNLGYNPIPVNAVKFTKRDLTEELTASEMASPYNSPNSFGKTYGEHRAFLELSDEEHFELYKYAKSKGLDFIETLCSSGCLSLLKLFTPDKLKVASRDLTNLPLLAAMAETKIPIILSTGMGGVEELDQALETINGYHDNITILHCLSQYPAEFEHINLNSIPFLKKRYPQYTIGYSDHSIGIMVPVVAAAMGAEVIEKHITLDRTLKGTDQQGSLAPEGIFRMMRDIRNVEKAIGTEAMFINPVVTEAKGKLERSIAANKSIAKDSIIKEEDLHLLSPGTGFRWSERSQVIGKKAKTAILKNELIEHDKIK